MFSKLIDYTQKLVQLLAAGEFSKLSNAIKLRINRIIKGKHSLRTEVELHQQELSRVLLKYFGCDNTFRTDSIKVAVIVRGGAIMPQSSAFIRLIAPLTHPTVKNRVSVKVYPENTILVDKEADICIVQRTALDSRFYARRLVSNLRSAGTHLIADTDDAFTMLDPSHSQHKEQRKRLRALAYILSQANQLWLSTRKLAELSDHPHKFIIDNSLDKRVWRPSVIKKKVNSKKLQMVYMGTATHGSDLEMIIGALDKLATQYPAKFKLIVIGVTDKHLERPWLKRVRQPKFGAMYPNFTQWFLRQGPFDIGLSPLEDTEFNRSKSDIKCLDYLAAGIIPVVSDTKPYQNKEISDYIIKTDNSETSWFNALEAIIKNPDAFRVKKAKIIPKAQKYIWSKRSSEQAARKILELLEQLKRT